MRARFRLLLDQTAITSAWVLVGFCVLEVALPRAGRAAATLLLRVDSDVLRWLETAGSHVRSFAANGIFFGALLTVVAGAACRFPRLGATGRAAAIGIVAASIWVFSQRASGDPRQLWWPAAAGTFLAAVALPSVRPLWPALGALVLQGGLIAYTAWALLVSSGRPARPLLDQASEVLVLLGIAGAGLAAATLRGSRLRLALAACALAGACVLATVFRDATHAVLRHVTGFGSSGLPYAVTAPLFGAALAGLVLATGRPGLFAGLLVALVCARRPDAHLIAGALASSWLLAGGASDRE